MGKLNGFDGLRTLRIQPELLIGGINGILKADYRLRDTLPSSLHSLTLYNLYGNNLINGKDLQSELSQMLTDTTVVDSLNFLIIQDTHNYFLCNAVSVNENEIFDRLNDLQQLCRKR